jgi:hypothetical protein
MAEETEISVKAIIEVVGKPKDHVENSLKLVLDSIKKDKGIKPVQMKVFRPKKLDDYFSAFAEVDLKFDEPDILIGFCFDYLPSSIEIISPESLTINSVDMAGLLNDLLSKLHNVNMAVSRYKMENDLLKANGEGLLKNILMLSIKEKPKKIEAMADEIGIKAKDLQPFVDKYVKEGKIKEKGGLYMLKGSLYEDGRQEKD